MSSSQKSIAFYFLLTASFIEGGAVMACELMGAKLMAPYYGTSLYVWAAVLAVTLGGLAAGYFAGGWLSRKNPSVKMLGIVIGIAGILTMIMPGLANVVLTTFLNNAEADMRLYSTLALMIYMFPPLVHYGATSPLIIELINPFAKSPGRSAGTVYSISTVGGILSTLLIGFYLLPLIGIKSMAMIYGGLMVVVGLIALIKSKHWGGMAPLLIGLIGVTLLPSHKVEDSKYEILMHETGILGEIKVLQHEQTFGDTSRQIRSLLINNVAQTLIDNKNLDFFLYDYPQAIRPLTMDMKKGQKVLVLGLGGGIIPNLFNRHGYDVTTVELDQRIIDAAKNYFYLDEKINVIRDDARHYIRTCKARYDLVMFDVFLSESPPSHVMTLESFRECKQLLTANGSILINFYGIYTGKAGKGARSVLKTLERAGYQCDAITTIPDDETKANMLIRAAYTKDLPSMHPNIEKLRIDQQMRSLGDAEVLIDDKPALEHYYVEAALSFKKGWNEFYTKKLIGEGYPVFN